eukprot:2269918-Lingulodinium_polyedra.AAC.1
MARIFVGQTPCHQDADCLQVEPMTWKCVVDNAPLAGWINGTMRQDNENSVELRGLFDEIFTISVSHGWRTRGHACSWVEWRKREFNSEADYLVNLSMDLKCNVVYVCDSLVSVHECSIQAWSDGGCRRPGCSAAGAI